MLIGKDFEKIHIELFGLDLVEPNVFVSDIFMFGVCVFILLKIKSSRSLNKANYNWYLFFLIYSLSTLSGAFGHLLYEYLGVWGKTLSWFTSIYAIYCLELGVINREKDDSKLKLYSKLSLIKMITVYLILLVIFFIVDPEEKPQLLFLPIAINTIIGVILSAGVLGLKYSKTIDKRYLNFPIGVLIMLPSAPFFLAKINIHPWFDKNDVSHILLSIGLLFFYKGIKKTAELN